MNNRGFTLIELLGVIVIVGLLALVIGISVTSVLRNSKSKLSSIQVESIEKAAKAYYLKEGMNESDLNKDSYSSCVEVQYLIDNDYIDASEIKNPVDNDEMLGSVKISYDSKKYKYTYQEKDCSICTLVSGEVNEIGSKYQCKVKDNMEEGFEDGYYFYVLSHNDDGTTNLIMERNISKDGIVATSDNLGIVGWYVLSASKDYGPVTAMDYLYNATKDWTNIPNVIINYEDENINSTTQQKGTTGYGSIITIETTTIITDKSGNETRRLENLKARLPKYDELHGIGKCLSYFEVGESAYGSCPLWLSNYLKISSYVSAEGIYNISEIYGYWTLSSNDDYPNAWTVNSDGQLNFVSVGNKTGYGVRPVITLKL